MYKLVSFKISLQYNEENESCDFILKCFPLSKFYRYIDLCRTVVKIMANEVENSFKGGSKFILRLYVTLPKEPKGTAEIKAWCYARLKWVEALHCCLKSQSLSKPPEGCVGPEWTISEPWISLHPNESTQWYHLTLRFACIASYDQSAVRWTMRKKRKKAKLFEYLKWEPQMGKIRKVGKQKTLQTVRKIKCI